MPFVLDAGNRIVLKDGATVRLTPKAFDTLHLLVRHSAQVVEKDQLLKEVWPDSFVEEGSLAQNINELRKGHGNWEIYVMSVDGELAQLTDVSSRLVS